MVHYHKVPVILRVDKDIVEEFLNIWNCILICVVHYHKVLEARYLQVDKDIVESNFRERQEKVCCHCSPICSHLAGLPFCCTFFITITLQTSSLTKGTISKQLGKVKHFRKIHQFILGEEPSPPFPLLSFYW